MTNRASRRAFYPALDTVRLLAIIGIIGYHYIPHRLSGGFIGVDIFFVLSGFLTTRIFLVPDESPFLKQYTAYLRRRVLRIGLPLLWMLVVTVAWCNAFAPEFLHNMRQNVLSGVLFLNNWWQVSQGASYFADFMHPSPLTHLWYLGVQMQLYLLLPLFLLGLRQFDLDHRKQGLVLIGLAMVSAVLMAALYRSGTDPSRVYYGTDTHAFGFFLGSAAAFLWQPVVFRKYGGKWFAPGMSLAGITSLLVLIFLALHLQDTAAFTYRGGILIASLAAVVLVCALTLKDNPLTKLFSFPATRLLGRATFSLYLWYYPVQTISNAYPLLRNNIWLQLAILLVWAAMSFLLMEQVLTEHVVRQGFPSVHEILAFLRRVSRPVQIAGVVLGFFLILSFALGMVRAPSGLNPTVAEMEAQMEENRRLLEEQSQETAARPIDLSAHLQAYCADLPVTFIGDSVLLAAAQPLQQAFPEGVIDAEVGRQLSEGVEVLAKLKEKGQLFDTVVVVLGSNGAFTESQINTLLDALGDRRVFLVDTHVPRPWKDQVNEALDQARRERDNVHMVNWDQVLDTHPQWLYEDDIHTNQEGAEGFTAVIARRLYFAQVNETYGFGKVLPFLLESNSDLSSGDGAHP